MHSSPEPHYSRHPVDDLEPEIESADAYREASKIGLRLIDSTMRSLLMSRFSPVAFWQAAFAMGLALCEGRSMNEVAKELGVSRAAISKGAKKFQRTNNLPPSQYMKASDACASYSKTRSSQL
jgi:transposase-like protein